MSIEETALSAAADVVKESPNLIEKIIGLLNPYAGLDKKGIEKAADYYLAEIEKSDMPFEAKMFAMQNVKKNLKMMRNQQCITEIAKANAKEGTDFSETSGVNREWLERYMDSAGHVSDEEMQLIWGKILAKEFEEPGSTPPNMIRVLAEITPKYAQAFQKICSLEGSWIVDRKIDRHIMKMRFPWIKFPLTLPLIEFLSIDVCRELESLGLLHYEEKIELIHDDSDWAYFAYINGKLRQVNVSSLYFFGFTGSKKATFVIIHLTETGKCLKKITPMVDLPEFDEISYPTTPYHIEFNNDNKGLFHITELPPEQNSQKSR